MIKVTAAIRTFSIGAGEAQEERLEGAVSVEAQEVEAGLHERAGHRGPTITGQIELELDLLCLAHDEMDAQDARHCAQHLLRSRRLAAHTHLDDLRVEASRQL